MALKRIGQSNADAAAILILIIGALIVAYILFISPEEREALLSGGEQPGGWGGGGTGGYGGGGRYYGAVLLLAERPGTLSPEEGSEVEHTLPSTTIFTAINTQSIKNLDSLYVKNSMFSKKKGVIEFDADPQRGDNFLLSFNVDKGRGKLAVVLNGKVVFNDEIKEKSPRPILLPKDYMVVGKNKIELYAEDVGIAFWSKHEFKLKNIMVSADLIDFSGAMAEVHFTITPEEYSRLEKARIEFIPECDLAQAGRFTAEANRQVIYSGFIDCGVLNKIEISNENIRVGDNAIGFVSDRGAYLLDRIKFISKLKQQATPTYYFNLPINMYEQIRQGYVEVSMILRFADYTSLKQGSVTINGFKQSFNTREYIYQALLDPAILTAGPNSVIISPLGETLSVTELRIEAR